MTPIRTLTLALVCALCAFSAPPAHAQIGTTCTITGTVYQVDGVTPAAGATLTVTRADKAGKLYANTSRVYTANSNGIITFKTPRTIGTDTAVIHVKASFGNLASGQILYVPSDSTATLESLVRYTANPTFVVVAVPTGGGSGDTSLNGHPRLTRIEDVEGQFTASTSDSLQQVAASVYVARNVAEGKAGADSVHTVLVALSNLIAGKGSADSIHTSLVTLYDLVAGKPNADSVHAAIDAMLKKADTTALHAQRFSIINDSLLAISLRSATTKNDLTAHIGTADAHLPSQTGQAGKVLGTNGTVSAWRTLDRTYITRNDTCIVIDSSTAGIYIVTLNPNCRGSSGSSIDSNRIVRTDIKAPTVSATAGVYDSVRVSLVYVDTLMYGGNDSVVWVHRGITQPFGTVTSFKAGQNPSFRTGSVRYAVAPRGVGNYTAAFNGFVSFSVVADTANGVSIASYLYTSYQSRNRYSAFTRFINPSLPTNVFDNPVQIYDGGSIGRLVGRCMSFPNVSSMHRLQIQQSSSGDAPELYYEIEITFTISTGSTSAWYIKLQ